MGTGFILNVIHVAGERMKRLGIDGLSRGDLLEGMMTNQNPLDFIYLNKSADERLGGRVVSWINSWWKDSTGAAWGGRDLKRLSPYDLFAFQTQDRPRLWTNILAAMEIVV